MTTALATLTNKLAARLDLGDNGQELVNALKATAFGRTQNPINDAQMTALLVVANQYGLNPWTKEIYAFPDKQTGGVVPVVGVDGWARIINEHPQFDGMEFRQAEAMLRPEGARCEAPEWIECVMYRKDRTRPIVVREYLDETYRKPFTGKGQQGSYTVEGPWQTHPKRFLRHKAMIQCARLAFGYGGIYDQDEAETLVERHMGQAEVVPEARPRERPVNQTEALKARLRPGPLPPAAPDLDDILAEIAGAETVAALDALSPRAKLMSKADQRTAGKAWTARRALLADLSAAAPAPGGDEQVVDARPPGEQAAMFDALTRALKTAKTADDIAECLDLARSLNLAPADQAALDERVDEARQRLN